MTITKIAVVGMGTMGSGIAQVAALKGLRVIVADVNKDQIEKGMRSIHRSTERLAAKIPSDHEKAEMFQRIAGIEVALDLQSMRDVDLAIEAVYENLDAKKEVFRDLASICNAEVIFASNTSSIPITRLAATSDRPDRFLGLHFSQPVPIMPMVEVIRGVHTSAATFETAIELVKRLGKVPVESADFPGFIANRILMPMLNEAMFALMEGVGTTDAIDDAMKLGCRHPMGPLELADFIGLDVCLAVLNVLYAEFKDPKYRPCPLLVRLVEAGFLGRKTGRGFHQY